MQDIFFADTRGLFERPRNISECSIFSFILSSIFYSTLSVEYSYTVITLGIQKAKPPLWKHLHVSFTRISVLTKGSGQASAPTRKCLYEDLQKTGWAPVLKINRKQPVEISHLLVLFTVISRSPLTLLGSKTGNSQGRCPKFSVSASIAPSWINSISHFIEAFSFRYLILWEIKYYTHR